MCYLRAYGPGGKNKYGDKTHFDTDSSDPEACVRCAGKVRKIPSFFEMKKVKEYLSKGV